MPFFNCKFFCHLIKKPGSACFRNPDSLDSAGSATKRKFLSKDLFFAHPYFNKHGKFSWFSNLSIRFISCIPSPCRNLSLFSFSSSREQRQLNRFSISSPSWISHKKELTLLNNSQKELTLLNNLQKRVTVTLLNNSEKELTLLNDSQKRVNTHE